MPENKLEEFTLGTRGTGESSREGNLWGVMPEGTSSPDPRGTWPIYSRLNFEPLSLGRPKRAEWRSFLQRFEDLQKPVPVRGSPTGYGIPAGAGAVAA